MNIREISKHNYGVLRRNGWINVLPRQSIHYIQAFQYIEKMISEVSSSQDLWDSNDFLRSVPVAEFDIVLTHQEINRVIFDKLKKMKERAVFDLSSVDKVVCDQIKKQRQLSRDAAIKNAETEIKNHISQISTYHREIARYFSFVVKEQRQIESLLNSGVVSIEEMIKGVCLQRNFTFSGLIEESMLQFDGVSDVILEHSNAAAKAAFRVNLGQFRVLFSIKSLWVTVHPLARNVTVDGYYHPHISDSGTMCWGNAEQTAVTALRASDLPTVFKILQSILTTYNPASPYIPIERIQAVSGQLQPGKTEPLEIEDVDDDGCCVHCGNDLGSDDHRECPRCSRCIDPCRCPPCANCQDRPFYCECESGYVSPTSDADDPVLQFRRELLEAAGDSGTVSTARGDLPPNVIFDDPPTTASGRTVRARYPWATASLHFDYQRHLIDPTTPADRAPQDDTDGPEL